MVRVLNLAVWIVLSRVVEEVLNNAFATTLILWVAAHLFVKLRVRGTVWMWFTLLLWHWWGVTVVFCLLLHTVKSVELSSFNLCLRRLAKAKNSSHTCSSSFLSLVCLSLRLLSIPILINSNCLINSLSSFVSLWMGPVMCLGLVREVCSNLLYNPLVVYFNR